MRIQSAKAKGRRGQANVARMIREAFNLKELDVISTPASVTGIDIWLSDNAREYFNYDVEVKTTETLNIWKAILQAETNKKDGVPMVVFSRNRSKYYAVVEFNEILTLLKIIQALQSSLGLLTNVVKGVYDNNIRPEQRRLTGTSS